MSSFPTVVNNFTHPVILADGRSWTRSYERHLETTGLGGDDLAYPLYTPVLAPAAGRWELSPYHGQAGNVGRIRLPNGWAVVFEHIDGRGMVAVGTKVKIGQLVCHSGNTGGVIAHLHVHIIDPQGNRHPIYEYFAKLAPAGSAGILTNPSREDDPMLFKAAASGNFYKASVDDAIQIDHDEAAAVAKATKLGKIPVLSTTECRAIIDGAKATKLRRMTDQATAVGKILSPEETATISAPFDAIMADEMAAGTAA